MDFGNFLKDGQAKQMLIRILNSAAFDYFDHHKGRPRLRGGSLPRNESEAKLTKGSAKHSGSRHVNNQIESQLGVVGAQIRNWAAKNGMAEIPESKGKVALNAKGEEYRKGGAKAAVFTHKIDDKDIAKIADGAILYAGTDGGSGAKMYQYSEKKKAWISNTFGQREVIRTEDIKGMTGVLLTIEEAKALRGTEGRQLKKTNRSSKLARAARRSVRSEAANAAEERIHEAEENGGEISKIDLKIDYLTENHFSGKDFDNKETKRYKSAIAKSNGVNRSQALEAAKADKMTADQQESFNELTKGLSAKERKALAKEMECHWLDTLDENGNRDWIGVNPCNGRYHPTGNVKAEKYEDIIKQCCEALGNSHVRQDTPVAMWLKVSDLQKMYPEQFEGKNKKEIVDYLEKGGSLPEICCTDFLMCSTHYKKKVAEDKDTIRMVAVLPAGSKGRAFKGEMSGVKKKYGYDFIAPPCTRFAVFTGKKKSDSLYGFMNN